MKIYKVLDGIWATREEAQKDVSVDDEEHVSDDEEVGEVDIRDMEDVKPK